jgi:hypothetical protein
VFFQPASRFLRLRYYKVQRYKIFGRFASISSIIFQKDSDLTFCPLGLEVGDELDVQVGVEVGVWKSNAL